ncbi:MAG: HAMP domain-containing histidine kinase [Hamadaea sp.]|nr:HAMP domain-containing histidine kinase [Hamadaea sp.]
MSHPVKLTIRARLTLVYGGLFVAAGLVLLGATYAMLSSRPGQGATLSYDVGPSGGPTPTALPTDLPQNSLAHQVSEDTWNDALNALLTRGGIALAVVAVAATALGYLLAGRLLRPLHRITETAGRIADAPDADRGLHERIALDGPADEIRQLADTFDKMVARLDHAFDGQRRFIANASHELRTPLTVNRSLLEVALYRTAATPELRTLGETLLEMNQRQERLLDGLLLLARSEREVTESSYVDMADIVEHVASQFGGLAVAVETDLGEAPTRGNPTLLERLVHNLVDNAVRYNKPDDGWVRVRTATPASPVDGQAVVEVSNTGPIVPKYEVASLFEPFRRLGAERIATPSPGVGLGLSIVRAIARAHGGEVHAEARDGGGLIVTVSLPPASFL